MSELLRDEGFMMEAKTDARLALQDKDGFLLLTWTLRYVTLSNADSTCYTTHTQSVRLKSIY